MIQVQIASEVTAVGVQGLRWVLIDAAEASAATVASPTVPAVTRVDAPVAKLANSGLAAAQLESPLAAPQSAAFLLAEPAPVAVRSCPAPWSGLKLGLLKAGVAGIGLALALWLAGARFGPARVSWLTASSATTTAAPPAPAPAPAVSPALATAPQALPPTPAAVLPAVVAPWVAVPAPVEPGTAPRPETREAPPP